MGYTINSVEGGPDGSVLKDYQFIPVDNPDTNPTLYNFCTPAPESTVVKTHPTEFKAGEKFKFHLAVNGTKYHWTIKHWTLGGSGDWENNDTGSPFADDDGEKGTFTAQSGMGEDAKAAGAS